MRIRSLLAIVCLALASPAPAQTYLGNLSAAAAPFPPRGNRKQARRREREM